MTALSAWDAVLALLRSALTGEKIAEQAALSDTLLQEVLALADRFDLSPLIAYALERNGIDNAEIKSKKALPKAIFRYGQQAYELDRMAALFERERIPFLPLKGAVMRLYYPEPWLRTSCDVDLLIHEGDLERAQCALTGELRYQACGRTPHDVSFRTESDVHIELHHSTIEKNRAGNANAVLEGIWDFAHPSQGTYRYVLDDEMFYFYHIAHMAKHFENGGCGVRPFLDLWVLNHTFPFEKEKRDALLQKGGLMRFADACTALSEGWMGTASAGPTELTDALQAFLLRGGRYGTVPNLVAVRQTRSGGRTRYLLRRLFVPYDRLKNLYPILEKHKWLLPAMEVRRWGRMVTDGRMHRTVIELQSLRSDSEQDVKGLLAQLGL